MPAWRAERGPGVQVAHLHREVLGGVAGVRVERARGPHVAARRAADAEIDPAGRERLQHAELLGHLERAVVRQHHAGAADADARRARGDRRHQDLGRRADDRRQAMVLAQPEARVAEALAVLGQRRACRGSPRLRCCRRARPTGRGRRASSSSQPCGWVGSIQRTVSGFSTGSMSRFTATASPSLRQSTHSSVSSALALISWCGTYGGM